MNFKKLLTAGAAMGTGLALIAALVLPNLTFAANYGVSPTYAGTSSLSVAQANQICQSLSDSVAAQTPFCAYTGSTIPVSPTTIADMSIMIHVTSPTTAMITWTTPVPTTSSLWYSSDPMNTNYPVMTTNNADGYSIYHTVYVTGVDLVTRHAFRIGGMTQNGAQSYMSGLQGL